MVSASSAAGSDPATMPQPATSRARFPVELRAAQRDAPLAVAVGVHPADRARVPLPVHRLELADQLDGGVGRGAADRGRRVHRGGQGERRPIGGRSGCRGRGCRGAARWAAGSARGAAATYMAWHSGARASRSDAAAYSCSSFSLADPSSAARQVGVLGRGGAARRRARQHQRAHPPAVPADEQLRGGADQAVAGEREAARVPAGQPVEQHARVDRAVGGGVADPGRAPPCAAAPSG